MKKKLWKLPIPVLIAAAFVLLSGGILIYALTKSTEAAGPVGYWKLDEGAGTIAYDASGNANDGVLTNFDFDDDSNWENGKVAGALEFNGVNDYIVVPNADILNPAVEIAVEAWVKRKSATFASYIVTKGTDQAWQIREDADGDFQFVNIVVDSVNHKPNLVQKN